MSKVKTNLVVSLVVLDVAAAKEVSAEIIGKPLMNKKSKPAEFVRRRAMKGLDKKVSCPDQAI